VEVTVVVATYGDGPHKDWARDRALPSVPDGVPTVHVHGQSLAGARNAGLDQVETEWVCFLDADDELTPGYFDAMDTATADLRAPQVEYVAGRASRTYMPKVAGHTHECSGECLTEGNWLVIGTVARTQQVKDIGGFEEWSCYEDWALWLRTYLAGASVEPVHAATYRAYVRRDSRNRRPSKAERSRVHAEIVRAVHADMPAAHL
jgi:glycosyltransferase involved in cell wall biosynthesis